MRALCVHGRSWLLLSLLVALAVPAAGAAGDPLVSRLERALGSRALRGAKVAALVVDRARGDALFERNADRPMVPASNLKVLTAVAVLSALGPTHRFVTEVRADAAPDAEGAVETLYLRGGGDPALTSEDFWRLAADLRQKGLRRVGAGGLVLDDSAFDTVRWHPGWQGVSARAYHAPVGALTVNYGAFAVLVASDARVGAPVQARVDPTVPFLRLTNRAQTGPPRARRTLQVDRRAATDFDQVIVSGTAPAGAADKTYYRSVSDPARYAGAVLRMQLTAVGIAVEGGTRLGAVPDAAPLLLAFEGHPLSEVVRRFLKYSNNSIGEGLVKGLGAHAGEGPGSWSRGLLALREQLARVGLPTDSLALVDGSGLSYENRASPRALVAAVRHGAGSFRFGPEFMAALPIAARDGTLEKRANGAAERARAKTGLLTRVTGLTGLAERPDGSVVAFSVLVNGFRGSADSAMDAVDDFVAALVTPAAVPVSATRQ